MRTKSIIAAGLAGMLAASCGGPSTFQVRGDHQLNVNEQGEPTPVKVRIYKLKDSQKFASSPFDELWTKEKDTLGEDKLEEPIVITVIPGGQPHEVDLGELGGDVAFIGVMALISKKPEGDVDGRRLTIPAADADGATVELSGYRVLLKEE